MKRNVFMISDGTGITAENLGNSLITQFESIQFDKLTLPYIDTIEKAEAVVDRINACYEETGIRPLIFMTLINPDIAHTLNRAKAHVFDLLMPFLALLKWSSMPNPPIRWGKPMVWPIKKAIPIVLKQWITRCLTMMGLKFVTMNRQILSSLVFPAVVRRQVVYTWRFILAYLQPTTLLPMTI